ncbi:serine/threonine-protein phosphatase 4 regulatory subunit 3 isoform X2 [Condylostylus longicornis]|uniref:serine/threonine-protein phosphatase 4 regulatory subunit 3 isoform X2 n=1 Tax=Condylostylus longicornis TaxID=2530218 RepID=UPI00244E0D72|nr:serine/threonine-protein phosphatase 4 regulatory subunit 3 isoform X2 [Condylostylus longicornis]
MTTDTRRRVKLYALNAERQWDDRGTGHVSSNYVDRLKGICLLVRAEADGSLLLESKIQPDTAYQKQQDTLIVWSEGENFDLALSFQEKAGCDEIWEKICQVQGKDPSVEITQDIVEESEDERFEEMSDSAPPIELPPCELSRLEDISETIASGLTTPLRKEKLAMALETENYIKKLLHLFHVCEDLDNLEGLHHLFEIFKNIFLLNKNALFEIMFADDTIFDVVGCLEYDPSLTQTKKHRHYIKNYAKFREVIPIKNPDLLAKIHQTYRVQYIQDMILPTPSVFVEDNMLNTLSSFIFFNKVEIVTLVQEDEKYLIDLFALLTDPQTPDSKRRDAVLFLKEFCNYAQNLQPQGKDTFYKTLTCLGVLQALEITLVMNDQETKSASIDILTAIVEYSPSIVRNYTLQQANKTDGEQMLINIAIEQMLSDSEPELGGAVQLMGVIRILLDPENMLTEKTDFLTFFYKHSIQTLIAPLLLNTMDDKLQNEDYQTVQLLGLVLDILSFCVEHHTYHIKNFITSKDLLKRILVLMKSVHTFLVLGALRLLRKIIALKDEFYNRHIVKNDLFAPVVDAFIRNNGRYNLLESAILELFEFVKLEDIKTLCVYFVEKFSKIVDEIEYVQTFKYLKTRYDQYQERLKDRDKLLMRNSRYRRDQRQLEEEEEIWFNEDDDFAEELETYGKLDKNGPTQHQSSPQQKNSASVSMIGAAASNNNLNQSVPSLSTQNSSNNQQSSSPSQHQHPLQHLQQQQQQQQLYAADYALLEQLKRQQQQQQIGKNAENENHLSSQVDSTSISNMVGGQQHTSLDSTLNSSENDASRSFLDSDATSSSLNSTTMSVIDSLNSSPADSININNNNDTNSIISATELSSSSSSSSPSASSSSDENSSDTQPCLAATQNTTSTTITPTALISNDTNVDVTKENFNKDEDSLNRNVSNNSDIDVEKSYSNSIHEKNDLASLTTTQTTTSLSLDVNQTVNATGNVLKKGLVDYEGDSDEEEEEEVDTVAPQQKKARIA